MMNIPLFLFSDSIEKIGLDTPPPPGDVGAAFGKMLLTFGALIFLLFGTYFVVKRFVQIRLEKGPPNGSIQILEKRMLSPKTTLYVVAFDEKRVLIAESQLEIKKIEGLSPVSLMDSSIHSSQ